MGIDYTPVLAYGLENTEFEGPKILPRILWETGSIRETALEESKEFLDGEGIAIPENIEELLKDFDGFRLWISPYSGETEGFGFEGMPGKIDEERVKEVFSKYNLGEPQWIHFTHVW